MSGMPPLVPPMPLSMSAMELMPGAGGGGVVAVESSSAASLACAFCRPDFKPAFVGSSFSPRSKVFAAASKSDREYWACLDQR